MLVHWMLCIKSLRDLISRSLLRRQSVDQLGVVMHGDVGTRHVLHGSAENSVMFGPQ